MPLHRKPRAPSRYQSSYHQAGNVGGWLRLQNPSVPESPWNTQRTHLSLTHIGLPWRPTFNSLVYKAGCP